MHPAPGGRGAEAIEEIVPHVEAPALHGEAHAAKGHGRDHAEIEVPEPASFESVSGNLLELRVLVGFWYIL